MKTMNYQSTRISVPTVEGIEIFDCSEIVRCEADKTSSFVYLSDGTHVLSTKSLKHFEKVLGAYDFMRIHKGNLVNIFHIRKYLKGKNGLVVMSDSTLVEVASRKKNQLLRVINAFPHTVGSASLRGLSAKEPAITRKFKAERPGVAAERKTPKTILVRKPKPSKALAAK